MVAPAESQLEIRAFVGGTEVDLSRWALPPGKSMKQFLGEALAVAKRYHSSAPADEPSAGHVGLRLEQVPRRGHVGGRIRPAARRSSSQPSSRAGPSDESDEPEPGPGSGRAFLASREEIDRWFAERYRLLMELGGWSA